MLTDTTSNAGHPATADCTHTLDDAARRIMPHFFRTASFALLPFAFAVSAVAATVPGVPPTKGSAIPRVIITGRDCAYDAPDTVAAGYTEFVLRDMGPELHHLQLSKPLVAGKHTIAVSTLASAPQLHEVFIAKLAPGKKVQDGLAWMEKQQRAPPFTPVGGVTGVAPGGTTYLSLDLAQGEYAFLCFLPDMKDGMPHLAHGMLQPFTVRAASGVHANR